MHYIESEFDWAFIKGELVYALSENYTPTEYSKVCVCLKKPTEVREWDPHLCGEGPIPPLGLCFVIDWGIRDT